jgi:hypothetical protein
MLQARRHRSSSSGSGHAAAIAQSGPPTKASSQLPQSTPHGHELRPVQRMDSDGSPCSQGSMHSGSSDVTCLQSPAAADIHNAKGYGPAAQPRMCSLSALSEACGQCFLPARAARSLVATVAVRWQSCGFTTQLHRAVPTTCMTCCACGMHALGSLWRPRAVSVSHPCYHVCLMYVEPPWQSQMPNDGLWV